MAIYDEIGPVYDLIYPQTAERVPFVRDKLHALGAKSVLELGCGTGLYLEPLKESGLTVAGIDVSTAMLDVARAKDPTLALFQQDATAFALDDTFDAILALSSFFVVLPDHAAFERCLDRCVAHMAPGGLLLAEMPNHAVEIAELNEKQEVVTSADGSVVTVIQYKACPTHWEEDWYLYEARDGVFNNRVAHCAERLYDTEETKESFRSRGFTLVDTWGDLLGNAFDPASSPREVWLWRLG